MNDGAKDTQHLYAWLARDSNGTEGVIAVPTELGVLPLVSTDKNMALSYQEAATQSALIRRTGNPTLVQFTRGPVIERSDVASQGPLFADIAPEMFPFTVEVWARYADRDGPPTFRQRIDGPGVLELEPFGEGTKVRIEYATGRVWEFDGSDPW